MINSLPYPLINTIAEGAAFASKFTTSLIFLESYKLEMQSENSLHKRMAQIVQTEITLDFTATLITHVYSPFSFDWKIHTISFLIGIIPKLCDLKKLSYLGKAWQKLDKQWDNIAFISRVLSAAVAIGLIAYGNTTSGLSLGLGVGFGFLESKKIIPIELSNVVENVNTVLRIGVFAAKVIAGSFTCQLILTAIVANKIIDYIGHKYYPLNTPITEKDEKDVVDSIRGLIGSQPITKSAWSAEHFKWKAIPRFFTLTCPNQTLEKKADLNTWFLSMESKFKGVVDYNWLKIKAKTLFLMRLQMFLNARCKSIYSKEKNQMILNASPADLRHTKMTLTLKEKFLATFKSWNKLDSSNKDKAKEQLEHIYSNGFEEHNLFDQFGNNIFPLDSLCFEDHISQIQELEEIRSILIQEIENLLDNNEKESFLPAIKADGYQKTVTEPLKDSVNQLGEAYKEFITTHKFDIKNEAQTFVHLSILGFLQEKRREWVKKELSPTLPVFSEEEKFHFIDYVSGNVLGLQSKSMDSIPLPNYLFGSGMALMLSIRKNDDLLYLLKLNTTVKNFCETLPIEMTQNKPFLNYLADLQILVQEAL